MGPAIQQSDSNQGARRRWSRNTFGEPKERSDAGRSNALSSSGNATLSSQESILFRREGAEGDFVATTSYPFSVARRFFRIFAVFLNQRLTREGALAIASW